MNKERKLIIAGNWKMNKTVAEALTLVGDLKRDLAGVKEVDIVVAPAFTALSEVSKSILDSNIRLAAQNMSENNFGAFTGEICAGMLKEFSVRYVILGHSERRHDHGETDELVREKTLAAVDAGLTPIVCVGETADQRSGGQETEVVGWQLAGSLPKPFSGVVAYEPCWAIGSGKTATEQDVAMMHAFVREELVRQFGDAGHAIRILYGGSVKGANAASLLGVANVGGALVGGASLKADEFLAIARAARAG